MAQITSQLRYVYYGPSKQFRTETIRLSFVLFLPLLKNRKYLQNRQYIGWSIGLNRLICAQTLHPETQKYKITAFPPHEFSETLVYVTQNIVSNVVQNIDLNVLVLFYQSVRFTKFAKFRRACLLRKFQVALVFLFEWVTLPCS